MVLLAAVIGATTSAAEGRGAIAAGPVDCFEKRLSLVLPENLDLDPCDSTVVSNSS